MFNPLNWFRPDPRREGVRPINVFGMRVIFALMFFMLGETVWRHVLSHTGPWQPDDAMSWSVWAAFSALAGIGIIHPLKMLPVLLLEIFYKSMWLILVALPLAINGTLDASPAAYQSYVFIGIIAPILVVPWSYVLRTYFTLRGPAPA